MQFTTILVSIYSRE